MSRQCSRCGAPFPAGAPFFCNRCGARLPAEGPADLPVCQTCGRTQTDPRSRFCDRCGAPLLPAAQPPPPITPPVPVMTCLECGRMNRGDSLFFCKKCGAPLMSPGPKKAGPGAVPRGTVTGAPDVPEPYRKRRGETHQTELAGSKRNIAIGIAVVVLVVFTLAFIITGGPGSDHAVSGNATESGLFRGLLLESIPGSGFFSNQATPVITDTPLNPETDG